MRKPPNAARRAYQPVPADFPARRRRRQQSDVPKVLRGRGKQQPKHATRGEGEAQAVCRRPTTAQARPSRATRRPPPYTSASQGYAAAFAGRAPTASRPAGEGPARAGTRISIARGAGEPATSARAGCPTPTSVTASTTSAAPPTASAEGHAAATP